MAEGLWRECAAWLTRCKVIPLEHKANAHESEIRVLALTLRDGVLLCNLINFLDAKAGLDFNRKPQMAQVCFFLNICGESIVMEHNVGVLVFVLPKH